MADVMRNFIGICEIDREHLVSERYELTERVPSAVRKNRYKGYS